MAVGVDLIKDLSGLIGDAYVRPARSGDDIDGVAPGVVVEPPTAEAVAAVLAWCSSERQAIVIRGGGTKLGWGRRALAVDVALSTRRLGQVLRYEPGDLTVTAEAGVTVARLNELLGQHRQYLPLDRRADAATVGGVLATNEAGPLRHRHGAPRDQVIGVRLATPDGRLASAGGHVVKNVAGYDLGKLIAGSFGSLAAIVSATFKLAPMPQATATLIVDYTDPRGVSGAAAIVAASQLDPLAVEVEGRLTRSAGHGGAAYRLSVRFGGVADVVAAHVDLAVVMTSPFGGVRPARTVADDDATYWREHGARVWTSTGTVVKLSWMPASLAAVLDLFQELVRSGVEEIEFQGRAAAATGVVRIAGSADAVVAAVARLRAQPATISNVVVVRGDADVKARVDVWALASGAAKLGGALKRTLDPAGVMNAGRGPL